MKNEISFFEQVYEVTKLIPKHRVTSYGAIAAYLGAKGSARMVGWALSSAVTHSDAPAHRVVNHKGLLTGQHHFATPDTMQQLLEAEGIPISDHQVQDFDKFFWDPAKELL